MAKPKDEEVDESALQAYLGDKKYGKEGMDALRKAGREDASKETMAKIRAKFDKLDEEELAEDEFAGDYATGEAGQWRNKGPKANKPATIGDLVGESEELDEDAVDDFMAKGGKVQVGKYHKPRKSEKTDYGSKHIGGSGDKMKASRTGTAAKSQGSKVVGIGEGQEDLDALKRLLGK